MKLRLNTIFLLGLILSIAFMAACNEATVENVSEEGNAPVTIELPQLSGEADAATMVLVFAPPVQPNDHINRWNPEMQENSCLTCHGMEGTGAPSLPDNHFYEDDFDKPVFRTYCIQCHGETNDNKPAFNRD